MKKPSRSETMIIGKKLKDLPNDRSSNKNVFHWSLRLDGWWNVKIKFVKDEGDQKSGDFLLQHTNWGYLSVSTTLTLESLTFKYWSTDTRVPVNTMPFFISTATSLPTRVLKKEKNNIVYVNSVNAVRFRSSCLRFEGTFLNRCNLRIVPAPLRQFFSTYKQCNVGTYGSYFRLSKIATARGYGMWLTCITYHPIRSCCILLTSHLLVS